MSIVVTKYNVKNPRLKYLIKYHWVLHSDSPVCLCHKLLPVNNIDMIFNLSTPILYSKCNRAIKTKNLHFSGIRNQPSVIIHEGKLKVIGVSFHPFGIYPLIKAPLFAFADQIIDVDDINRELARNLMLKLDMDMPFEQCINFIEEQIEKTADFSLIPSASIASLRLFCYDNLNIRINEFCAWHGINIKQLERLFLKHVGITPKRFLRLCRFQAVSNRLLSQNAGSSLTSDAYENDYYDQTHFIKDFRSFAGCTPKQFLEERTIKAIIR